MTAVSILPSLLLSFAADLLLITICCFALRFQTTRIPTVLILVATGFDILNFIDLLLPQLESWGIAVPLSSWRQLLAAIGEPARTIGELLNILGIAWLLAIVLENKRYLKSNP